MIHDDNAGPAGPANYILFTAIFAIFTAVFTQFFPVLLLFFQVMNMIRQASEKFTKLCLRRSWIDRENEDWCIYVLEKWLGICLFFLTVILWMLVSRKFLETMSFLFPLYFLRRRMGGWHANSRRVCFLLSIGSVILTSRFLGDLLVHAPLWSLLAMNGVLVLLSWQLQPGYPPQVNYGKEETVANHVRKNRLLLLIVCTQVFSTAFLDRRVLCNSICGVALAVVTVIIQKRKRVIVMKKIEKIAAKVVNKLIGIESYGWPPVCIGTFYQARRPKNAAKMSTSQKALTHFHAH